MKAGRDAEQPIRRLDASSHPVCLDRRLSIITSIWAYLHAGLLPNQSIFRVGISCCICLGFWTILLADLRTDMRAIPAVVKLLLTELPSRPLRCCKTRKRSWVQSPRRVSIRAQYESDCPTHLNESANFDPIDKHTPVAEIMLASTPRAGQK